MKSTISTEHHTTAERLAISAGRSSLILFAAALVSFQVPVALAQTTATAVPVQPANSASKDAAAKEAAAKEASKLVPPTPKVQPRPGQVNPNGAGKPAIPSRPGNPAGAPGGVNNPAGPNAGPGVPGGRNAPADGKAGDGGAAAPTEPIATIEGDGSEGHEEMIRLAAFSEPVQLTALVNLVATTMKVNVSIIGDLQGTVAFNAAVPVKKTELVRLVDSLLGQSGWTITQDPQTGWYLVMQEGNVPLNFKGDIATTRVFATPNVRPSAVQQAITAQLGGGGGQPGMPAAGGSGKLQAFDELGIIIATDSQRKLGQIDELITRIIAEYNKMQFIRVELSHIAAATARDRVLQLLGQSPQGGMGQGNMGMNRAQVQPGMPGVPGGAAGQLDNLGDRLTVDPQGNALIFRGLAAETDQVTSLLHVIDVPNSLKPRSFFAGANAASIANFARDRGYGEVTTIAQSNGGNEPGIIQQNLANQNNRNMLGGQNGNGGTANVGGPMMVVDEINGNIIYYGTPTQHEQFEQLIEQLDTQSERIVIQEYKLKNSKAEDIADVVMGLLNNQSVMGSSALLPDNGLGGGFGGTGGFGGNGFGSRNGSSSSRFGKNSSSGSFGNDRSGSGSGRNRNSSSRNSSRSSSSGGGINNNNGQGGVLSFPGSAKAADAAGNAAEDGLELDGANSFVIADVKNNQILIKAPAARQKDFKKLIEKLDLRRPQVYLEVQIVAVTWSDTLRLAFETQLINAKGSGGLLQSNFGLTTAGTTITDRRNVSTGLSGLTAAIVKSDQLPIVMTALQNKADTRIVSAPSLLVDDNETAELMSVEQQPYSTTQVTTGTPNTTSFGGYEDAGTQLSITPSISEDGYLKLEYDVELSNFTSTSGNNGSPPPKLQNSIKADSITVPSDTTVIVGGLNVDTRRKTRVQIPILGDIPIIGQLFQDYNTSNSTTTLYVFITPRIMREPNFTDLTLLTEGPQKRSKLDPDLPKLKPSTIDISAIPSLTPGSDAISTPTGANTSPVMTPPPAATSHTEPTPAPTTEAKPEANPQTGGR